MVTGSMVEVLMVVWWCDTEWWLSGIAGGGLVRWAKKLGYLNSRACVVNVDFI